LALGEAFLVTFDPDFLNAFLEVDIGGGVRSKSKVNSIEKYILYLLRDLFVLSLELK